jgi:hypothetical protein
MFLLLNTYKKMIGFSKVGSRKERRQEAKKAGGSMMEAGGSMMEAGGSMMEAGGRRQYDGGRRQEAV